MSGSDPARGGPVEPSDRVMLVTGASSGIGEAVARRLAREPFGHLVLVARREERLRALASELGDRVSYAAVDLTAEDGPARVVAHLDTTGARRLDLLVNNAGAAWRAPFGEGGYANVRRTMELNFDAQLRLTEALLPRLRASAPSAIVNVASTAARISRAGTGAYSASKAALAAWSDALYAEERAHGVHVGLVMPGFIATEGFPARELTARAVTRWTVSTPARVAEAIIAAGLHGRPERYVPRGYGLAGVLRVLAPRAVRRLLSGGAAASLTTRTGADEADGSA